MAVLAAFLIVASTFFVFAGFSAAKGGGGTSSGGCPNGNAIGGFSQSMIVGASVGKAAKSWAYYFSSLVNQNPVNGTPGLIQYCVYATNGTQPATISHTAVGADGKAWGNVQSTSGGFFGWGRTGGDPNNIPLDGSHDVKLGSVTWTTAPANQTILLHINDSAECMALYGSASNGTCFVYPAGWLTNLCGGRPACKTVAIDEATSTNPLTVPVNTVLHIHYTYTIVNQPWAAWSMVFYARGSSPTTGANTTGINDFFTCEQILDPNGTPGTVGVHPNYQGTGLDLSAVQGGPPCNRVNITLVAGSSDVIIQPGDFLTFTVDMTTRAHGFTGPGTHCINSGVIVKWIPSQCMTMMQIYRAPMVDVIVA